MSRNEAEKSRARIVEVAGEQFREHGYDGIGIAGLMAAAGRTQGGFYKQFDDKEALVVEATEGVLAGNRAHWDAVMAQAGDDPLAALRDWYLSPPHVGCVADGCAYAALAAEAPRHGDALRDAFEAGLEASIGLIADRSPLGGGDRAAAIAAIAQMVGTLILARAVRTPAFAAEILASHHSA
jgi:TetR/AcrR family transcriptional repressor of nem operon